MKVLLAERGLGVIYDIVGISHRLEKMQHLELVIRLSYFDRKLHKLTRYDMI